jgi:microcystin-dependent protein
MSAFSYTKGGASGIPFTGPIGSIISYAGSPGKFSPTESTLSFVVYPGYHNANLNYKNTTYNSLFTSTGSSGNVSSISNLSVGTNAYILETGYKGSTVITDYDKFTITWTGYFLSNYSGTWRFSLSSDDEAYLWIGPMFNGSNYTATNALINPNNNTKTNTVDLVSGVYYPIRIFYGNGGGAGSINLSWSNNNLSSTSNGSGFFYTGTIAKTLLDNWLLCDGSTYNISSYPLLANAISNKYGGDGETTFSVPNLQSHFISGCAGYGSSFLNLVSGTEYYNLQSNDLPTHSHSGTLSEHTGGHGHNWDKKLLGGAGGYGGYQLVGRNDAVNNDSNFSNYEIKSDTGSANHNHNVGNDNYLDNIGNSKPLRITPAHIALIYMIKYQ